MPLLRSTIPTSRSSASCACSGPTRDRPAPGVHPTAVVAAGRRCSARARRSARTAWSSAGATLGDARGADGAAATSAPGARSATTRCSIRGHRARGVRDRRALPSSTAGVVIGSDGFGFAFDTGRYHKVPQVGNVVIGDDVEIGANTTIDRATTDSTRIGDGTKIDNLVQIGHNVVIGEHCIIVAQVGISGSTRARGLRHGRRPGRPRRTHHRSARGAMIGAQSGVTKSVAGGDGRDRLSRRCRTALCKRVHGLHPEAARAVPAHEGSRGARGAGSSTSASTREQVR